MESRRVFFRGSPEKCRLEDESSLYGPCQHQGVCHFVVLSKTPIARNLLTLENRNFSGETRKNSCFSGVILVSYVLSIFNYRKSQTCQ